MLCAISGSSPITPVVNRQSGIVYEKSLILKYIRENEGKDPISGETITEEDLLEVKTSPSAPLAPPRPPQLTSLPALLQSMQNEWDSTMLEAFQLRADAQKLRQDLSHALYKEDAAMRVLARVMKERDQARAALADLQKTLGVSAPEPSASADTEMDTVAPAEQSGVPPYVAQRIQSTHDALSATRRKRKAPETYVQPPQVSAYTQSNAITSMHSTKPPGITSLATSKNGQLVLTGGMDKNLIVHDRDTGKNIATCKGHTKKVTAADFVSASPSDAEALPEVLASASLDKTIRLWTLAPPPAAGSKKKHEAYTAAGTITSHSADVTGLAVHPCRSIIASSSADGSWALHDVENPSEPKTVLQVSLPRQDVQATAIAFHPDGNLLGVGCSDSSILMFQTATGGLAHEFVGHKETEGGAVNSISFSENGYILASSSDAAGSAVNVWDLRKTKLLVSLPASSEEAKVNLVAWDPSALYLSAVGTSLRVWSYKAWDAPVLNFEGNTAELTGVAWDKEGAEVLVGGMDRAIRVISAPSA